MIFHPNERSVRVLKEVTLKQTLSHSVNKETEDLSDERYARVRQQCFLDQNIYHKMSKRTASDRDEQRFRDEEELV